jgi:hypothetical protein
MVAWRRTGSYGRLGLLALAIAALLAMLGPAVRVSQAAAPPLLVAIIPDDPFDWLVSTNPGRAALQVTRGANSTSFCYDTITTAIHSEGDNATYTAYISEGPPKLGEGMSLGQPGFDVHAQGCLSGLDAAVVAALFTRPSDFYFSVWSFDPTGIGTPGVVSAPIEGASAACQTLAARPGHLLPPPTKPTVSVGYPFEIAGFNFTPNAEVDLHLTPDNAAGTPRVIPETIDDYGHFDTVLPANTLAPGSWRVSVPGTACGNRMANTATASPSDMRPPFVGFAALLVAGSLLAGAAWRLRPRRRT